MWKRLLGWVKNGGPANPEWALSPNSLVVDLLSHVGPQKRHEAQGSPQNDYTQGNTPARGLISTKPA